MGRRPTTVRHWRPNWSKVGGPAAKPFSCVSTTGKVDRCRRSGVCPGTRRAMLERGDADISTGFPPKDFDQMIKEGKLKIVGVPIPNALWYVALNTSRP